MAYVTNATGKNMASHAQKKELNLGVGLRYPVFVGSGVVLFTRDITSTDPEFQVILHATATATQMAGPKILSKEPPKASVGYDKKTNRVITYYSYPQACITTEECIDIVNRIKTLPYPEHMLDRTKQRNIILNYDFNNTLIDDKCLVQLLNAPHLFYAIELTCNKVPDNLIDVNTKIRKIKKYLPTTKVWLKLPHPTDVQDTTYLTQLTAPDAIVLGQGRPAVNENIETFNPTKPTLEAGTHLYQSTCATVISCRENMQVPMIVGGGIHTDAQVMELLKYGASGVQVTSAICKNWMNTISLYKKLRKSYR